MQPRKKNLISAATLSLVAAITQSIVGQTATSESKPAGFRAFPTASAPAESAPATSSGGTTSSQPSAATTQAGEAQISLNFPDSVPLKTLVDYVSARLKMNILYDDASVGKKLTIKAPAKIPESSLMGLLESALKMSELALVDGDQKGWKRIVPAANLVSISGAPGQDPDPKVVGNAVTQVLNVTYADINRVDQLIKPFLSSRGANTIVLQERGILIVTDYANNMERISSMVKLIDQPRAKVLVEFRPAKNVDSATLAQRASALLTSKMRNEAGAAGSKDQRVEISAEARTNQLVLIGTKEEINEADKIISALDVAIDAKTKVYQFRSVTPERVDKLVKDFIGELAAKTRYQSAIDKEGGMLIVTAPDEIHDRVVELQKQIDITGPTIVSPVRFYKLTNTTATEVLRTIQSIEGVETAGLSTDMVPSTQPHPADGAAKSPENPATPTTPVSSNFSPVGTSTTMPASHASQSTVAGHETQTIQTPKARVTADQNTNSIIIITDPTTHAVYETLIKQLDKRRPQVLLECILVTLDTSGGFSFGVEISGKGMGETLRPSLAFSSYGLSNVDPNTGALTIKPGLGFNGAFLSADIADIIIRAVSNHSRAKVVSAPRILVNDNATGTLASVNEAPFTSINASNTVSTTSFAGYASAGTTISVTPHISEGNHLQIEYQVTLSSFTGQAQTNSPPPRQTNTVQSKVTIPDGGTIVVGGLNRMDQSTTLTGIPVLDQIPIISQVTSNRTDNKSIQSLFVFIRPIVMRDEEFEDLKYISARDNIITKIPEDEPTSEPLTIP